MGFLRPDSPLKRLETSVVGLLVNGRNRRAVEELAGMTNGGTDKEVTSAELIMGSLG